MKITRRSFLKYLLVGSSITIGLNSFESYVYAYEPSKINVEKVNVTIPHLPKEFESFTIAQLSDLHRSKVVKKSLIDKTIKIVNALKPDCIVITGDLANNLIYLSDVMESINTLKAPFGVYIVMGNWERFYGDKESQLILRKSKVKLLYDQTIFFKINKQQICLAGVSDDGGIGSTLKKTFANVDDSYVKILLSHNPYITVNRHKAKKRIDLILSGHTHGGQIVYPFIGPIAIPTAFGKKYPAGMYYFDDSKLYVNRGIGVVTVPYRVNCPPEITLFSLKKSVIK
jgi:hypothetical protein